MEFERIAHMTFGASHGVGVGDHLTLGGVADDFLTIGFECDHAWGRLGAFWVRDDFDFPVGL